MNRQKLALFAILVFASAMLASCFGFGQTSGTTRKQSAHPTPAPSAACAAGQMRCVTQAERQDAARRAALIRGARPATGVSATTNVVAAPGAKSQALPGATLLLPSCP